MKHRKLLLCLLSRAAKNICSGFTKRQGIRLKAEGYEVDKDIVTIYVIEITAHNY